MSKGKSYRFELFVNVNDKTALRRAAEERAVSEGVKLSDWRKRRRGTSDDLRMVFDPGVSPAGTSILDSCVEG